ncbi:MAG: Lrp/AsnC family transcriptional regulator [Beijerinckiaceae bacterium]
MEFIDRAIVEATQAGLPLTMHPYAAVAERIGVDEDVVVERLRAMLADGRVRRIGAALNHYAFGLTANGMTVWDIEDMEADFLGRKVGALDFVTHCYLRPRRLPLWPYNLFAMAHGRSREEVLAKRAKIAGILGSACRGSDILFSTELLKKTGVRFRASEMTRKQCSG